MRVLLRYSARKGVTKQECACFGPWSQFVVLNVLGEKFHTTYFSIQIQDIFFKL